MWIRSQDNGVLADCNSVCIEADYEHGAYDIYSYACGSEWHVGRYSTREKAMKVLNDLCDVIGTRNLIQVASNPDKKAQDIFWKIEENDAAGNELFDQVLRDIFQMPPDDKVDA